MKKMFMAGLLLAGLATSCSEDLNVANSTHKASLTASVTAEQTRAAFDKSGAFYWSTGDKIGVLTSNGGTMFSSLELKSGAGESSAAFEGVISGTIGDYAVYPYSSGHSFSGNKLTYSFPDSYSYNKVDQLYFPSEKDGNSYNSAMWAQITNFGVNFKHLGGVFMIKIAEMPSTDGTLEFTTTENLCGKYTADLSATEPALVNTDGSASDAGKTVTITFKGATTGSPGVFYIPVPTGSYNARLTLKDNSGNTKLADIVAGSFTIARKDLRALSIGKVTIDAGVAKEVSSTTEAGTALANENNTNVAITGKVESGSTISIPAVTSSSTTTKAKTLTLESVAESASITVSDNNASSSGDAASSLKELTVSIPNMEGENKAPKVTVTMPNSTVTLAGNAGTATFQEVTASTAENTLVVSEGVTVKKLIVAKGNVRVNKGATVEAIEKATDNSSGVIVYYEEGASVPSSVTDITLIKIPVGTQVISTEAQFATALTTGGNYILQNDLTLSTEYTVASTLTLDLNNKTLTAGANTIQVVGGNLTLKNGNVVQSKGNNKVGLHVGTNGTLVVDGITYTGEANCFNRIYVLPCQTNVNVTIKNSTIKGGYYSFFTDASTTTGVTSNCTVNLENSEFTANETGVVVNIPATVTMTNCKSSGNHQGALLRGGTYNISGCTFTLNASLESSNGENKWMKAWKSGNQCAFAALTIGNYQNGAYKYETKATFTGTNTTVVTGTNATSFPAIHVCSANNCAVTITGFANNMTTPASGCKTPAIEYGTNNITVDGDSKTVNVTGQ